MKSLTITLLFFLFCVIGHAQDDCFSIEEVSIRPGNPSDQDSISILVDNYSCRLGSRINSRLEIRNDTLFLSECYFVGLNDKSKSFHTETGVGFLDTGRYNVHYSVVLSDYFLNCIPYDTLYYDVTFQVRKYSSSNTIVSNPKVLIYPNPSPTGKFTLELKEPIEKLEIRNLTGKLIKELQGPFEVYQAINMENTPPGLYFLEITEKDKPPYLVKLLKQ